MTLEQLGDLLDDDTRADELVERDPPEQSSRVRHRRRVLVLDELDEMQREAVPVHCVINNSGNLGRGHAPKLCEGIPEFTRINRPRPIPIKVSKEVLPVLRRKRSTSLRECHRPTGVP